jgi:hypothetical protein
MNCSAQLLGQVGLIPDRDLRVNAWWTCSVELLGEQDYGFDGLALLHEARRADPSVCSSTFHAAPSALK